MKHFFSFLFSIGGVLLTITTVLLLNEAPPLKPRTIVETPVSFSIAPPPKIKPQSKPKVPQKQQSTPPPLPTLAPSLTGLSFGVEGLEQALVVERTSLLEDEKVVMTTETVDLPPRPTQQVAPEYPNRARKKGVEGYVTLSMLITEFGRVKDILVVDSYPKGVFELSATTAIRDWRFIPGEYENNPVSVRVTQTLRFSLK
jgi:protein TonB